jgi:hypothetical protein
VTIERYPKISTNIQLIISQISDYTGEITMGIAGGVLVVLGFVALVLYRNWKYEQELDSLLWKIDFRDIKMHDVDKENGGHKVTRVRI